MNSGAATDPGLVRERNEDRYWIDDAHSIFLVVDGLGGHAAGELAAEIAVREIQHDLQDFDPAEDAGQRLRRAILRANNRIHELAGRNAGARGMACVLTLATIQDGELTIGHVGDSRLYLLWNGAIRKLTSDHSPVGEEEDAGELTEQEAMRHPRRNEIFRDVGSHLHSEDDESFIEIRTCRFRPDAAVLLCSDGVTDQLTGARIREIVSRYQGDAEQVARELVEAANQAGGSDNATAVFMAGPDFGARKETTRLRLPHTRITAGRRLLTGRLAFLAYGLLLGMLVWAVFRLGSWIKL
ncbi:MAG: serine/threonine-protein phosphatase [Acidobacteriia bacterium]|nr:serine/threonine-protein phosphatase [Terriglobia bacterium]